MTLETVHPHGKINSKNGFKNFEIAKDRKMQKLNINHAQPLQPLFKVTYLLYKHINSVAILLMCDLYSIFAAHITIIIIIYYILL